MTEDRMALIEAIQKADDGNFLRALAETVLQIIMDADIEALVGAGRHERSDGRLTYRNGYRDRTLETRPARSTCASEAAPGIILPRLSGAAPDGGEGFGIGHPGSLDRRRLHPSGRRTGAGDGHDWHLQV